MKRPTENLPRLLALVAFWLLASLAQAVDVVTYLHTDVAGTPLLATDAGGAVVWKENYQPFGGRLNHPPAGDNDQWFAGKPYDSGTGLSYFGARYYDPLLGRFLGLDPAPVDPGDIHGLSKYNYGNNNPYRYVDPDGRAPLDAILFHMGGGALVGGAMAGTFNAAAQYASTGTVRWGGLGGLADALGEGAMIGAVLGPLMAAEGIAIKGAAETTTVIGRVKDLKTLGFDEKPLLDRLPNLGDPKANWQQNAGVLREEMRLGRPIRDASPGDTAGQFLNAERNLLRDRGWTFDPKTTFWNPPTKP